MDKEIIERFFSAFFNSGTKNTVYSERIPEEMMASPVDSEGWFTWKPVKGTIDRQAYHDLEKSYGIKFPKSFIDWHKAYFFPDGDLSLVRLPSSLPSEPLAELEGFMEYDFVLEHGYLPFASDGWDTGLWIFDTRKKLDENEFPIAFYDFEHGIGEIIFSSFSKALECLTYYLEHLNSASESDVIKEFIRIDPQGAGTTGLDHWIAVSNSVE